jgi:hypothetical protein
VGTPRLEVPTTRFARSATTFGPVGRVGVTIAVLLPAPVWFVTMGTAFFALGLWGLLAHTVVATFVLKHVWRSIPTAAAEEPPRFVIALRERERRLGPLGRPIRLPRSAGIVLGVGFVALAVHLVSNAGEGFTEYALAAAVLTIPVGFLLAWLSGQ